MKSFKSLSSVRLLFLTSLFLASCGEQTELEQPGVTNGETVAVTKELRFDVLPMQTVGSPATRSDSSKPEQGEAIGLTYGDDAATRGATDMTSDESDIHSAYILQFDGTAPTSVLKTVQSITAEELNGTASITCDFQMTDGVKNRVYVVANLTQNQIDAIDSSVATLEEGGEEPAPEPTPVTLADFEKPVVFAPGETLPETGLPMSSMQDIGVGDVFDVFRLKSVLAKLKFTCKTEGATLSLKGVPSGYSFYTQAQPGDNVVRPKDITYDNSGVALTSGTTYYIPENLSGRNDLLIKHYTRALGMAAANAIYVEITNGGTVYNLLLGDGSASDFNFAGGYSYNINATIYGIDTRDLRVGNQIPVGSAMVDMNASGETANCYVATAANTWYMFNNTVMGNGKETPAHTKSAVKDDLDFPAITPSKLNPASADVLWESVNTAIAPAKGAIVNNNIYLLKDRILFKTGSSAGNAVIAAKDASDNVIWSWHIWRTEGNPNGVTLATITNGADFTAPTLKMMDRNLGALRAAPNSNVTVEQDYGLFYQWGRKDPFQTQGAVTTATGGAGITPADAVKNPTTFYTSEGDWTTRNDNLWGCPLTGIVSINATGLNKNAGSKSIYDPCPAGWRVAPGYTFANITKQNSPWNATNKERDLSQITTSVGTPFPIFASGLLINGSGVLRFSGEKGHYCTSSPNTTYCNTVNMFSFGDSYLGPSNIASQSQGFSVRCVQ